MRLRSLELRGFKSFADPVRLPLTAKLIGIVGPNGCGKSNIADALRWILGEQKGRLLRIEKADNLIFNGTQKRKPLPFAEVSLEVEDFSPELPRLTFTRRVYRDGESEYLLNGTPARMKDFLSYFWQVRITPHSILDGGQVEALIQDRGGARRALLESLAGIERYHHHKKEALAELEKTAQALAQVESLLNELQTQAQELARQAHKVETYRQLRQQYEELLLAWIAQELHETQQALAREARQRTEQQAALQALQENLAQLERQIQHLEQQSQSQAQSTLEAAYHELQQQWEALLREESALQERQKNLHQQLADLQEEATYRERQLSELLTEEARLRSKKDEAQKLLLQLQETVSSLQHQQRTAEANLRKTQDILHHYQHKKEVAQQHLSKVQQELSRLQASLASLESQKEIYQQRLSSLEERAATLAAERRAYSKELESILLEQTVARNRLSSLQAQQVALQAQRERLLARLRHHQARLEALSSERQTLQALLNQAAGWPAFLSEIRQKVAFWRTEDIFFADEADLPLLSFLLRLEPPTLWVRSAQEADALHELLQTQKEGVFCVRIYTPTSFTPKGGWADRIETLPEFAGLAHQLWGDISISETPGPGRTLHPNGRLLWLPDGRAYHLSPAHTAHIGLPHRIQRLTMEGQRSERHIETLRRFLQGVELEQGRLPLGYWQREMQRLSQRSSQLEKYLATLTAREEETRRQQAQALEALQHIQAQQAALQKEIAALLPAERAAQQQVEAHTAAIEHHRARLSKAQSHAQAFQKALQEHKLRLLQAESDLRALERSHKLTFQHIEEIRQRQHQLQGRTQTLQQQVQKTKACWEQLIAEKDQLAARKQDLHERLEALRAAQRAVERQLAQLRPEARQKLQEARNLQEALARAESRRAELEHRRALLVQRLAVELDRSVADLPPPPTPRLKADQVEAQLTQLKEALQNLGQLNFEAAAALEALQARQTQLLTQKADIQKTLQRLRQLIHSLDREAQDQFLQTFEAVRERFKELFQSLFAEGDSCDLVLLQPDSPLTSDIEIIACPKGKRPLSLQQLSGGEKVLTVLALLFGTFAVQPSALCVLDEVDASLDDVNAQKFGRLLQHFAQHTPQLVITHNKITMAHCEQLFGVTMPEPGVSAVLGVELAPVATPL